MPKLLHPDPGIGETGHGWCGNDRFYQRDGWRYERKQLGSAEDDIGRVRGISAKHAPKGFEVTATQAHDHIINMANEIGCVTQRLISILIRE